MTYRYQWDEGGRLLKELGREAHLATRIAEELKARGWSQERLAREMTRVGCPVPQSAISKIVKPGRGGPRAITVDEAIALSRVFDIPLEALLLPPAVYYDAIVLQDIARGPAERLAVDERFFEYAQFVQTVALHTADAKWSTYFAEELAAAKARLDRVGDLNDADRHEAQAHVRFLEDVMERRSPS